MFEGDTAHYFCKIQTLISEAKFLLGGVKTTHTLGIKIRFEISQFVME